MTEYNDKIEQLNQKLETLLKRQEQFSKEIYQLHTEIYQLKTTHHNKMVVEKEVTETPVLQTQQESTYIPQPKNFTPKSAKTFDIKSDVEKFIGENLISKIGIIITVIGVAIGAKYAIENQLISPLTRIILGYLMGLGLLGIGIKLKKNYENYSAVLVSGAMAIMFFITYSAYSFYALFPQSVAFMLMLIFTAFTVVAAIKYNKQVIAHIGLVGAYSIPFLLSDDSGKVSILFSYMAIINVGILIIAFKKYWKPLYYSSFLISWLIVLSWYLTKYQMNEHFALTLGFLTIFFATFYAIFLAYKLLQKEKFEKEDIVLLLANSFLFYGTFYAVLNTHPIGKQLLGLFTLCNAMVHLVVCVVIYKQKLADRNLFYLVAGLVLIFITIAIPVELDGNWVTLLWAFEAALLFWIGRTKNASFYEKLSYPLLLLAFFSIFHNWIIAYFNFELELTNITVTPVFNINFFSSMMVIASFAFINYLNNNKKYIPAQFPQNTLNSIISFALPSILLIVLYSTFWLEISIYWNQLYNASALKIDKGLHELPEDTWNYDLLKYKTIWIINYSLLFFALLAFVNNKKIKNSMLTYTNLVISAYVILVFLGQALYSFSELRESYLQQTLSQYYHNSILNIGIRYISFAFVALMIVSIYKTITHDFLKQHISKLKIAFDAMLYITIVWIASSELINWMDIMKSTQSYKLGLSILWGVYALLIIALGIWKKKKHLRIGAIALFAITLIKLFIYDISYLDTIAKTIVFVLLGIFLLIISFLYNKYKNIIRGENEE